jgi:BirA family biotin operon repressor/biotin-[acetyl-CoA-carboxylase] ligase
MDTADLLAAIADGGANGRSLAEHFGVSRTMVWKRMQQLRSEGVIIEGAAGEGYTLVDAAGFGPCTTGWRCRRSVHFVEVCGSTNVEARRLAESSDSPAGLLVVADQQEAGRGRLGRRWDAEPGQNLLFSLVLQPTVLPQLAPVCVLAWAAAMAEVLDCKVKWPNDLVTPDGQKLGGILAGLTSEAEQVRFVVLGVGINVNQQSFPDLPFATSLSIIQGHAIDRAKLLGQLVTAIEAVPVHESPSLESWRARSHTLGRRVRVGDVEGVATEVRDDGALIVDGCAVLAGDVEMVES